ncbi:MAG: transposase [Dehalococcoidia bacterium]
MRGPRKQHSAEFKAKVAIEAIKGQRTLNELAGDYGVHPVQISQWKKQALDGLPEVFGRQRAKAVQDEAALQATLYQQIGQLTVELDWVKKKAGVLS